MNVSGYSTDAPADWTAPYPAAKWGAKARLLKGDVMYPGFEYGRLRDGREGETPNWFNWLPARIERYVVGYRPFLSLGAYNLGVYVGWKVYGVDSAAYLDYPGVTLHDVYTGSRAMTPTFRFTLKRKYQ